MSRTAENWEEYQILDAGDGEKLEVWNGWLLRRPDPQAFWPRDPAETRWDQADAVYHRSHSGGGSWSYRHKLPASWQIHYQDLTFRVAPTGFKHTGVFPEQAANWDWMSQQIRAHRQEDLHILNLFGYTGCATMACARAGASEVVHVDASKGMVNWAKENMTLCGLQDHKIRFLVDDCLKFVRREQRRGRTYQGIVMDPPSYGRGPDGEMWKFEDMISELLDACLEILDEQALFLLINSYTTGFSSLALQNLLSIKMQEHGFAGPVESGEVALPIVDRQLRLPCGIYAQWSRPE